jgi:hypothetical protein
LTAAGYSVFCGSKFIGETKIGAAAMGSLKTDESARKKLEKYGERI